MRTNPPRPLNPDDRLMRWPQYLWCAALGLMLIALAHGCQSADWSRASEVVSTADATAADAKLLLAPDDPIRDRIAEIRKAAQPVIVALNAAAEGEDVDPTEALNHLLAVAYREIRGIDEPDKRQTGLRILAATRISLRLAGVELQPLTPVDET